TRSDRDWSSDVCSSDLERFKKCPWLFRKGNKTGQHRQRRSQMRLRMENLIQRLTNNGDVIVQFFCAVASAQPFSDPRGQGPAPRSEERRVGKVGRCREC